MSANESTKDSSPYRITPGSPWANAWLVAAVVGLAGVAACAVGYAGEPRRFAFAWLFGFMAVLTVALGALFFVVIQHLTAAYWSVTVRRTAEMFVAGIPLFALLFLPIAASVHHLYPWAEPGHGTEVADVHGEDMHGEPAAPSIFVAPRHDSPQGELHAKVMAHKSGYLSQGFFFGRAAVYFLIWILLGLFYVRSSLRQDETKDMRLTVRMQALAPVATIATAFTLTFAAFDWMMSLEPAWFSTIYGVYVFGGSIVSIHALVAVVTISLRNSGYLGDAVNVEHQHDLGKMTFGFIVFWAYVGFSQMMLIWYANIPEETIYYHARWHAGGWKTVSLVLLVGHFALPFLFLISRAVKRRLALFRIACLWVLGMHLVDIYWFVMPNVSRGRLSFHWLDIASVLAVGGLYFAVVFFLMRRYPLIPIGDPRLDRSLHHVNA